MDVDTIERGRDFRKVIDAYLADSSALLVLIGRNWLGTETGTHGRRLDDPTDLVRMEVASALQRDIPLIPILVDGAQIPQAQDLPEDIRPLVFRQAARVTHENFASDMDRIERDFIALIGLPRRWRIIAPAGLVLLAVLALGLYQLKGSIWRTSEPGESPETSGTAAVERAFTSFEVNTDRPGGDYTSLRLSKPEAVLCQRHCAEDQRCLAWTYVAPGYQEAGAVCWLKNTVTTGTRRDACCTSGVAYYRRPK